MDFFGAQQHARSLSKRLVILFILAVLCLVLITQALLWVTLQALSQGRDAGQGAVTLAYDPVLFAGSAVAIITVIALASLYKIVSLRGGGRRVAEALGGRLLIADNGSFNEQRLLNIVEEMAIASGMPVPPVYVLDEAGINAFAAGYTPADAVIGVTRGALDTLSRDELQGVIAHEFSHILHGDMRLNIRLMGLLHGILVIGMLGYYLLRSARFQRRGNNTAAIVVIGLGLGIIGAVGVFFGKLIKAAVSRQREFLADASAVQYTRNPDGIASALKHIAAHQNGSLLDNPAAEEISHSLFGAGSRLNLQGLFATHPPLERRIRRLDPDWNGEYIPSEPRPASSASSSKQADANRQSTLAQVILTLPVAMQRIGNPDKNDLQRAGQLHQQIPVAMLAAARTPFGARAIVYLLLLEEAAECRAEQWRVLERQADPAVLVELEKLLQESPLLSTELRLPVLNVALSALRQLSENQYHILRDNIEALSRLDSKPRLSRWLVRKLLVSHLDGQFSGGVPEYPVDGSLALTAVRAELAVVLSLLAYLGGRQATEAFNAAARELAVTGVDAVAADSLSLEQLDKATDRLAQLNVEAKQTLLRAALLCVHQDGQINQAERDLLATLAEILQVPLPASWH
ncbi:M48 family metallopeptidase [Pseudohongiella spirulinae]|uniref:Heat shock protein HtpX n=1 Tax=Pseudohongiella spirulinae TaxID=1249552 RepID=A0A0S2KE55_9GAMM|nr:M48 family metallopeptidase [Pseudohongiella spirulinae]ALO46258.1 Heat shock protein HtpX [Pseudohongiella spirulinae]